MNFYLFSWILIIATNFNSTLLMAVLGGLIRMPGCETPLSGLPFIETALSSLILAWHSRGFVSTLIAPDWEEFACISCRLIAIIIRELGGLPIVFSDAPI